LAARELKNAAKAIALAALNGRQVILAMGGHPIKVGLGPVIANLLERGVISAVSSNGSVMVHDSEVALVGATSEDVTTGLKQGDFGVTKETGDFINRAIMKAARTHEGLGRAMGLTLIEARAPNLSSSVLATAARLDRPFTVHAALGTDVYNIHPDFDGSALGAASGDDFKIFCRLIAGLNKGVFLNLGSAVILPEVFLKALTLVRNLGHKVEDLTTIDMDFIRQYRPRVNVVERPTNHSGQGYSLTGHHEIMFPLLMSIVLEELAQMKGSLGTVERFGE
jgi:hypothetical protein